MEATTKKKLKWGIGVFVFLLLLAGGIYYFGYSETAKKKKLIKQIQEKEKDFTEERKDELVEMTLEQLEALLKSLTPFVPAGVVKPVLQTAPVFKGK